METETYKNAKLILERFDPEAKKKSVSALVYSCFFYQCASLVFPFDVLRFCLTSC